MSDDAVHPGDAKARTGLLRTVRRHWRRMHRWRVFDRPVFILAGPRSGSTFLYEMLASFDGTRGHHAELALGHVGIRRYLQPQDITPAFARDVRDFVYHRTLWSREEHGVTAPLSERLGLRSIRYIDKTIVHCFEVPALRTLFPDALFVFLKRDPRAAISSMLEGYPRDLPEPANPQLGAVRPDLANFLFPLPPDWQDAMPATWEAAHAWAWCRHIEAVQAARATDDPARWFELSYEQLVAAPRTCLERLAAFADLRWSVSVDRHLADMPLSRTTQSAPSAMKWRARHGTTIATLMPLIAPTMQSLGYHDPAPGVAEGRAA